MGEFSLLRRRGCAPKENGRIEVLGERLERSRLRSGFGAGTIMWDGRDKIVNGMWHGAVRVKCVEMDGFRSGKGQVALDMVHQ